MKTLKEMLQIDLADQTMSELDSLANDIQATYLKVPTILHHRLDRLAHEVAVAKVLKQYAAQLIH